MDYLLAETQEMRVVTVVLDFEKNISKRGQESVLKA